MIDKQIHIFEDVMFIWTCVDTKVVRAGPYYCYNKAKSELITHLIRGTCAWITCDGRKTESRRVEEA